MLVIDGSKSLGENNFEIVKEFVIGILDTLTVSPKAARVGLLQYSTQVRTEFTLKQFSTAKDMKKAVSQMKYMGKGSMTGLALKQMTERSFTEAEGARRFSAKVPRLAIVFTDGRAQDDVAEWATKAKQSGKRQVYVELKCLHGTEKKPMSWLKGREVDLNACSSQQKVGGRRQRSLKRVICKRQKDGE